MATSTFASFIFPTPLSQLCQQPRLHHQEIRCLFRFNHPRTSRVTKAVVFLASSTPSGEVNSNTGNSRSKKSVLANLIQDIEPLDVSLIQKDVPPTTLDAMKRTISGMLGLLPSEQFQVLIEALWESLSKLLVSSIMTGYTLRNAEYRLCLERNLDIQLGDTIKKKDKVSNHEPPVMLPDLDRKLQISEGDKLSKAEDLRERISESTDIQNLGKITPEAEEYILSLQSRLSSVKKELHEVKRKSAALQMQQFVGEEKNDLLDFLRSLQPDKVAELSEPTCPEMKDMVHSVVHGLLATLSPKMHSKVPHPSENSTIETVDDGTGEDCVDVVENPPLRFQPLVLLTRDYLARLLFWCMLLGHYLRGLEYRLELTDLLSLASDRVENDAFGGDQVA